MAFLTPLFCVWHCLAFAVSELVTMGVVNRGIAAFRGIAASSGVVLRAVTWPEALSVACLGRANHFLLRPLLAFLPFPSSPVVSIHKAARGIRPALHNPGKANWKSGQEVYERQRWPISSSSSSTTFSILLSKQMDRLGLLALSSLCRNMLKNPREDIFVLDVFKANLPEGT